MWHLPEEIWINTSILTYKSLFPSPNSEQSVTRSARNVGVMVYVKLSVVSLFISHAECREELLDTHAHARQSPIRERNHSASPSDSQKTAP